MHPGAICAERCPVGRRVPCAAKVQGAADLMDGNARGGFSMTLTPQATGAQQRAATHKLVLTRYSIHGH